MCVTQSGVYQSAYTLWYSHKDRADIVGSFIQGHMSGCLSHPLLVTNNTVMLLGISFADLVWKVGQNTPPSVLLSSTHDFPGAVVRSEKIH